MRQKKTPKSAVTSSVLSQTGEGLEKPPSLVKASGGPSKGEKVEGDTKKVPELW